MAQGRYMPRIEPVTEDTVLCFFYFTSVDTDKDLHKRCNDMNNIIETISKNYIWHRDAFRIYQPINSTINDGIPLHLASRTCFGDNVEDEWFIVYIVFQLTQQFSDMIVQVRDNDGEFLLIEAANVLPSWANPENTDNHVFIANNHIHIISPNSQNLESKLNLHDAIKMVTNKKTFVSADIDQAILTKIGDYPKKIELNKHRAVINLPVSIATVLSLQPDLIAPIVCAYCSHDVLDARACKNVSLQNCVTVTVTFSKFLYAMLIHSKIIKCNSTLKFIPEKNKRDINGFKLACGFQMIMNSCSDIFSTKEYNKFLSNLIENGYFKNNIVGSKEYTTLLENAKHFFSNVECPLNLHVSNQISQLMSTEEYANEKKKIQINTLSATELCEDNEDWLNIQPDQLNDFLNINYGKKTKLQKNDVITPGVITSELAKFLTKSSDFEGIETNSEDENSTNIDFDADEFSNCLIKIMNLLTIESVTNDFSSESNDDEIDEDLLAFDNSYDNEMDEELKRKLNGNNKDELHSNHSISQNIVQSLKEEKALSGPSSNLLKAVGINKKDVIDSDDD